MPLLVLLHHYLHLVLGPQRSVADSSGGTGGSGGKVATQGFGMGKSLMVHEVQFSESQNCTNQGTINMWNNYF